MSVPLTPEGRLNRISQEGLCIGCGLCQAVAGPKRVRMRKVQSGCERPVVEGVLDHETVDRIYDVCPGTRLDGLPPELAERALYDDLIWGPYQHMRLAWASDPEVRHQGSTGGLLTALGQYLVSSDEVAFVLHVKAHQSEPGFGESQISITKADILDAAGSRYGPTAALINIEDILSRGEPFAYIGKPCDIAGLRNLARFDARVNRLVKYWLTPVCGGFMPPAAMGGLLRDQLKIDPHDLKACRYRGFGCPGPTRLTMQDGSVRELSYTDFWGTDESQWSLPFRCKICPDGIGEAADIAASDSWPGGSPDPETEDQDPGVNAAVIRTENGMRLMRAAEAAGFVTLGREVDPTYMSTVQPHQVKKKLAVRARWDGLLAEGRLVPRSSGLRLDALRQQLQDEEYEAEFNGTRIRVKQGRASEEAPLRMPDSL